MSAEKLFGAIGYIDSDIIDEASAVKESRSALLRAVAAAAVVVLTVACVVAAKVTDNSMILVPEEPVIEIPTVPEKEPELIFNEAAAQLGRADIYLGFSTELSEEQIKQVFPGLSEAGTVSAFAAYDRFGTLRRVSADFCPNTALAKDEVRAVVTLYPGAESAGSDYRYDGEPIISYYMEHEITAGYCEMTDETVYYASFAVDDIACFVELCGGEREKEALPAVVGSIIRGDKADFTLLLNPVIPELRDDKLSESEARSDAQFGAFVPRVEVDGLAFESARRYIDQNNDRLTVLWSQWETQGYDQLYVVIRRIEDSDRERIVAPGERERYDLSLYPIPRAKSVPEELWEVVDDPIFLAEDITADEVRARSYLSYEEGDSDGYRVDLSVLFGDVVVSIDSKGQTPEQIYDIIASLGA